MPKMLLKPNNANSILNASFYSSQLFKPSDSSNIVNDKKSSGTEKNNMNFPQRLMEMLSNEENSDIITWLPHGKAFLIIKRNKFYNEVLPKYFKETKCTSFTRKLTRWGFNRVSRGPETGAYYHRNFQRDDTRLINEMSCALKKETQSTRKAAPVACYDVEEASSACIHSEKSVYNISLDPTVCNVPTNREETPSSVRALDLVRDVQNNIHTIKQLTADIYELSWNAWSHHTTTPNLIPAMNPNSEFSISVVKAAEDVLKKSISTNPSPQVQKKNVSQNVQMLPEQQVPISRKAPAA